jgi:hypothetical protein
MVQEEAQEFREVIQKSRKDTIRKSEKYINLIL